MFTPRDHDQQRSDQPCTRSPAHLSHACADMINSAHGALQRCTAGTSQTPAVHRDSYPRIPADHDHQGTQVTTGALRAHTHHVANPVRIPYTRARSARTPAVTPRHRASPPHPAHTRARTAHRALCAPRARTTHRHSPSPYTTHRDHHTQPRDVTARHHHRGWSHTATGAHPPHRLQAVGGGSPNVTKRRG